MRKRTIVAVLGIVIVGLGACREGRRNMEGDTNSADRVPGVGVDTTRNGDATRPSPSSNDMTRGGTVTPRDSGAGDSTRMRQTSPRR
jgi:hypothetical protein